MFNYKEHVEVIESMAGMLMQPIIDFNKSL